MYELKETNRLKAISSPKYNLFFDKKSGFMARWGETKDDDPDWSPFGPELADIELTSSSISDIEHHNETTILTEGGCSGLGCKEFCYKRNVENKSVHMSLGQFKRIMDRMPQTLTQIAFGLCSIDSHPELWEIFEETRSRGCASNVTVNGVGITDDIAARLANACGAVAVSVNPHNKQIAYDAVKRLSQDNGMSQVNFHIVLAEDTVDFVKSVIDDIKTDSRLSKLNALVMLSFKDKGQTGCFQPITSDSYKTVVEYCEQESIRFGFDSCSAHAYLKSISGRSNYKDLEQHVEPCESGLFSIYINVFGTMFACSFCENEGMWEQGLNVCDYDTMEELWLSPKVEKWRETLLGNDRKCPFYEIGT